MITQLSQDVILRISSLIADEVYQRGLHEYGSAYSKIYDYWSERPNNKPFKMSFSLDEVDQLRQECKWVVKDSDWDSGLKRPYAALMRQIDKLDLA